MSVLMAALKREWGWTGVDFAEVLAVSRMGHLLIRDTADHFHYLDPETRELIALGPEAQATAYFADPEVALVWRAEALVDAARTLLGPPGDDEVYTLTPDALLAGDYAHENLTTMALADLVSFAGQVAFQTRNLPDGTPIQLKVID
jgi:hypothetical protein